MATVELYGKHEHVIHGVPSVCACCGKPSTHSKEREFVWFPAWTYLLMFLGGLPFALVVACTRRTMTVSIPLCDKHRYPWLPKQLLGVFMLLFLFVGGFAAL